AAHESEKEYFRQQQIGDPDVNYWRHCCAFDCGNAYFTAVELPNHSGAIPEELWKASDYTQCYIPNCEGPIKWELKKAEEFRIDAVREEKYHASVREAARKHRRVRQVSASTSFLYHTGHAEPLQE
ncbi:hypothetical protein PRIPAC_95665, partial [Pristionchus pacificus]